MSRLGKSDVTKCDFCGDVITHSHGPDTLKIGDKLRHFCPESDCLQGFFIERYLHEINLEVEKRTREEFNMIHRQVCPACRHRLVTKVL